MYYIYAKNAKLWFLFPCSEGSWYLKYFEEKIESKLNEDSGIYGFDMESIAHTKAIYYPYMGHSLCHTISILGPYMAHITRFGEGIKELIAE